MLKRDKKQYGMIAFSFFCSYICNRLDEAIVFPRQSNLPGIKNPLTRSSGNKKTRAEVLKPRIPSQGHLKKKRGCRKPIRVIKKKSNN